MRRSWPPLALALLAGTIAHLGGAWNGFTNWDDPGYLLDNPLTVDPLGGGLGELATTPALGYPVPVTVLSYALQRAIFGLDPAAFHLISLALHLVCVALVGGLCRRLGAGAWAAGAAAALFAVHPVTVEPVAWVVGQKDLLAAGLILAALVIRAGPVVARDHARSGAASSFAVGLLAVLAIGAKPSAVAAVILIPALDVALGRRLGRGTALLTAAIGLAAAASILLGLVGHGFVGGEAPATFGLGSIAHALWSIGAHARHLVWPAPLLARYFPPGGAGLVAGAALGIAIGAGIAAGALLAWRRGHLAVAFSLFAAVAAYVPVAGLVPLSRGAADSYLYLPLALAMIAVARGLDGFARRRRASVSVAAAAVLAVFALLSAWQTVVWRDSLSLWKPVAAAYPDDPRAIMRLGDARLHGGDLVGALLTYEELHDRFPSFPTSLPNHALALEALGKAREAETLLARATRLAPTGYHLETYGFFLVRNQIAPTDDAAARRALGVVGVLLAERGKRLESVRRAAALLRGYGDTAVADALDRRASLLERR